MVTADLAMPHDQELKFTVKADAMKGTISGTVGKVGDQIDFTSTYSRSASPFKYVILYTHPYIFSNQL